MATVIFGLYFIPALIALMRDHRQKGSIILLNLLGGWTVIGWIVAIVWAVSTFSTPSAPSKAAEAPSEPMRSSIRPLGPSGMVLNNKQLLWGAAALAACFGLVVIATIISPNGFSATMHGAGDANVNASTAPADSDWKAAAARASVHLPDMGGWDYEDTVDPMTSGHTRSACVNSINDVHQSAPYEDTAARLCIVHSPRRGLDVYVQLKSDGQVLCDAADGCTIPVRFERRAPRKFPGVTSADGSTETVFIRHEADLVREIKRSASMTVEIELYQNGDQALIFPTLGLKWP